MKRILIITVLALVSVLSANAQYVANYKDIKGNFNPKEYFANPTDPYAVGWTRALSFFVPGSGQLVMHETVRGLCFMAGGMILTSVLEDQLEDLLKIAVTDANGTVTGFSDEAQASALIKRILIFSAADLGVAIWSCIDAGRIAKVKNMYYQDACGKRSAVEMNLAPNVLLAHRQDGSVKPTAGMSLCFNF
jgi:hypothetical protein